MKLFLGDALNIRCHEGIPGFLGEIHFLSAQIQEHFLTICYTRSTSKLRAIKRISGTIHNDSSQFNTSWLRCTTVLNTYIHSDTVQGFLILSDKHIDFRSMTTFHMHHPSVLAHNHVIRVVGLIAGANHFVEALCL